jgi:hypothetical protein
MELLHLFAHTFVENRNPLLENLNHLWKQPWKVDPDGLRELPGATPWMTRSGGARSS